MQILVQINCSLTYVLLCTCEYLSQVFLGKIIRNRKDTINNQGAITYKRYLILYFSYYHFLVFFFSEFNFIRRKLLILNLANLSKYLNIYSNFKYDTIVIFIPRYLYLVGNKGCTHSPSYPFNRHCIITTYRPLRVLC